MPDAEKRGLNTISACYISRFLPDMVVLGARRGAAAVLVFYLK
jgi:hypothetical protein